MDLLISSLSHPPLFLDIIIAITGFAVGRLTGGVGKFLLAALFLVRVTRWYFSTHPEAGVKLAKAYDEFEAYSKKQLDPKDAKYLGYFGLTEGGVKTNG